MEGVPVLSFFDIGWQIKKVDEFSIDSAHCFSLNEESK